MEAEIVLVEIVRNVSMYQTEFVFIQSCIEFYISYRNPYILLHRN